MGLFSELFPLCRETHLTLLLSANASTGTMTISVMPRAKTGAAPTTLKDLTMIGTPDDFDAEFLPALTGYRDTLLPLMAQAEATKSALKQAAETKPAPKPKAPPPQQETAQAEHGKPPSNSILTDVPREANNDPDTDWMKNRQPALF